MFVLSLNPNGRARQRREIMKPICVDSNVIRTHTATCRTPSGCPGFHGDASPGCAAKRRDLGFGV